MTGYNDATYDAANAPPPADFGGAIADVQEQGLSPAHWLIVIVLLLAVLNFVGLSEKTAIEPAHIVIGGYNAITITLIAVVGISGLKILLNYVHIPGLTDVVNAV